MSVLIKMIKLIIPNAKGKTNMNGFCKIVDKLLKAKIKPINVKAMLRKPVVSS